MYKSCRKLYNFLLEMCMDKSPKWNSLRIGSFRFHSALGLEDKAQGSTMAANNDLLPKDPCQCRRPNAVSSESGSWSRAKLLKEA